MQIIRKKKFKKKASQLNAKFSCGAYLNINKTIQNVSIKSII